MTNKTSEAGADIEALCRGVLSLEGSTTWKTHYEIARAYLAQAERLKAAEAVCLAARGVILGCTEVIRNPRNGSFRDCLSCDNCVTKTALAVWRKARGET